MTRVLYALGRWCADHGVLVLVLWLVLLGGVRMADRALPPPALDPFVLAGTDSASAQTLLNRAFPGAATEPVPLVVADDADLSSGIGAETVDALRTAVEAVPGVNAVRDWKDNPDLLADDGRATILQLTMAEQSAGDIAAGNELLAAATHAAEQASPTVRVAMGGYLGAQISRTDTRRSEALGLMLAVVVLLFTLHRGWPVAIPLATALMAVGIGLAIIGLLGRLVYIPEEAPTLGTMLGLGVGIDYALFLVTRHRTLLRRGFDVPDAVGRTAGTAGAGMVFAGATLLAAVTGLALTGISFLAWLGYSAAVVVTLALLAALTLVPALLSLMGLRVLPRTDQHEVSAGHYVPQDSDEHLDRGMWARISNAVTSHPWPYAIGATALLLTMAAPMLSMQFQQVDASALPDETTAHQAGAMITESFGPGWSGPLAIVAQMHRAAVPTQGGESGGEEGDPRTRDPRLVWITESLRGTDGISEVTDPVVSPDGGVVIWRAVPATGPSDKATEALVTRMRADVLPAATAGADLTAYVGGVTAARTDLSLRIADRLLPFILGVATLSFVLLMIAYRSLVIPAKAAAMNLLSISAAYGVVVAVFQWGWGAALIGLDGPVPIEAYVPMMMFAILFGLSMDYEVFLLTAFTEHYQRSGSIVTAVRRGLADTGQLITAAALIMVVVFASFILPDNSVVKMFGVGLATAVLVDATVVRCVLVPSLMVLAAKWTWWLPGWLDRALPQLHVEGDPAQLSSVGVARTPSPRDSQPATGGAALFVGVLVAWVLGGALVEQPSGAAGAAIALSAVGGATLAHLPRSTRGGGGALGTRLVLLALGALLSAASFRLVAGLTPATVSNTALQASTAILVPALLVVVTPLRRGALPVLLGSLVTVGALTGASATAVADVLVIALLAALVTRLAGALGRLLGRVFNRESSRASSQGGPQSPENPAGPPGAVSSSSQVEAPSLDLHGSPEPREVSEGRDASDVAEVSGTAEVPGTPVGSSRP